MSSISTKSAVLWCIVLLAGFVAACGGGGDDAEVNASPLAGVWSGTLTDAAGKVSTFETEHVATGTAIKGSARIVTEDGTIHHGVLTGAETAAGMDWAVDFSRPLGVVDFRGVRNGKNITLSYVPRASGNSAGTGTVNLARQATFDLKGTYQVDWSANGQSGNFQFTVASQAGVNSIQGVDVRGYSSYMNFNGSCVGSTIALGSSVFVSAGSAFRLVQMHFGAAEAGASGTVAGTSTSNGTVTPFSGAYTLKKIAG